MKNQLVLTALAVSVPFSSAQTPAYHANLLGISDGRTNMQMEKPVGMNRWGQVVGTYGGGLSGGTHAVLWTPASANDGSGDALSGAGTFVAIESSGGLPPGTAGTWPGGINDRGQIAGGAYTPGKGDGNQNQSWMWRPTPLNDGKGLNLNGHTGSAVAFPLINLPGGTSSEHPSSINNNGQIVGYGAYYHLLLWTPSVKNGFSGTWTYDPTYCSPPVGINDAAQIAGSTCESGSENVPYLHNGVLPLLAGDLITSPLWPSPPTPNTIANASGLNQRGHLAISGVSSTVNAIFAYLYKNGAATDISTGLPSHASALNNYDQVVGFTDTDTRRATLFQNGQAIDLNKVNDSINGLLLKYAIAINDAGQILCTGVYPGSSASILLTPNALVKNPITVTLGKVVPSGSTYTQTVTVTNRGATPITGPISVVIDGLPAGVTLANTSGTTFYAGPGSPYANVSTVDLAAGAATPSFTLMFTNPGHIPMKHTARLLAGPAPR